MPATISDLPNEIDNQIASELDAASLVALCQVSRHWLTVARPFLYVNVNFTTRSGLKVKQLLFQCLKYPNLAKNIKSIIIKLQVWRGVWGNDDVQEAEEVRSDKEEKDLRLKETKIKLSEEFAIFPGQLEDILHFNWPRLPRICKDYCVDDVVGTRPALGACLAVILGLAINIEELSIPWDSETIDLALDSILTYHQPTKVDASGEPRPLSKLQDLTRIGVPRMDEGNQGYQWAPLPPNVESVSFSNISLEKFEYTIPQPDGYVPNFRSPYYPDWETTCLNLPPCLQTLELNMVSITPSHLLHNLGSGYFRGLQTLILHKILEVEDWYNTAYMQIFTTSLSEVVPSLENLELEVWWSRPEEWLTYRQPIDTKHPFGSLKDNACLKELDIDLNIMINSMAGMLHSQKNTLVLSAGEELSPPNDLSAENNPFAMIDPFAMVGPFAMTVPLADNDPSEDDDTPATNAIEEFFKIPDQVLPPSIEKLTFNNVKRVFMERLLEELASDDSTTTIKEFLQPMPECKKLSFFLYDQSTLSKDVLPIVEKLKTELKESGIEFNIDNPRPLNYSSSMEAVGDDEDGFEPYLETYEF
ncbi:hypothetical protein CC80DRAFT_557955 [Byssothecium circinans]|uniref:F-box domain-containing protein n=1 Tax=Byssothecium circinans TaxID=147558 RepID=A0A6A5U0Z6_9PLEO|nr:hypothetical protein CC80DRAFT_557955 [Byssothecium circinans]